MAGLQQVELVEDGPLDVAPAGPRPSRRRWAWATGGLVAVVGLLVGGQVALDARHVRHETRFDDVPGVLLPLPQRPSALWTTKADGTELDGATQVGRHLVAVTTSDEVFTVREIDRASGAAVWTTAVPVDDDARTDGGTQSFCVPAGADDLAVCAVGPIGPNWIPAENMSTQLVVVDAGTGELVATWVTPLRTWTAGDGEVQTASSRTAGDVVTWTLTTFDTAGQRRARQELGSVAAPPGTDDAPGYDIGVQAVDGYTAFTDQGAVWRLRDGAVIDELEIPSETSIELGPRGLIRSTPWNLGPDTADTTLFFADGTTRAVEGGPVYAMVDDGSADDVVLTMERPGSLVARDASSGRPLWSQPGTPLGGDLVLDGVVYLTASDGFGVTPASTTSVVALDARTGEIRWARPTNVGGWPMTDGRAVYVDATTSLRAFALDDGTTLPDRDLTGLTQDASISTGLGMLSVYSGTDDDRSAAVIG
ncbi:PQQ-binding-like beta-propeller repeat protein [Cellulomonas sp. PhB150]|uniref:outer membrane protein assembly factor BamB family protein n=1 Tax=Cellulomonas sp. PhB150 TaxID=2485188 RepID=UPI000F479D4A|nr:PQQ-binding-like beta-propeller repeat protein [Cellulomonas sp. PhB150]ROS25848.1 putative pyrroloquinoline-quinone binding quinoprotein [Cellulomonas sp. PhB150]